MPDRRPYAADTNVSPQKSRAEIMALIESHGGDAFTFMARENTVLLAFRMHGRFLRFLIRLPDPNDAAFQWAGRRLRTTDQARAAYEQEVRRRWRVCAFGLKAKLELVESGFASFDDEFLAYFMLPTGETVAEHFTPQLDAVYRTGIMPELPALALPAPAAKGGRS